MYIEQESRLLFLLAWVLDFFSLAEGLDAVYLAGDEGFFTLGDDDAEATAAIGAAGEVGGSKGGGGGVTGGGLEAVCSGLEAACSG